MTVLGVRTQLKTLLNSLTVPVKFRGETLPLSGNHVVIDLISDTPLVTLEQEENGSYTLFQVGAWAKLPSEAITLMAQVQTLLEPHPYYRRSSRFLKEDDWDGVQADYDILS